VKRQITSDKPSWRHGFLTAALGSLFLLEPASVRAANLIVNGDFETGDFTGWTLNFTPPKDAAVIATHPAVVYRGSNTVDFSFNDVPATAILAQTFNRRPAQSTT